jgi:hypothetical protein
MSNVKYCPNCGTPVDEDKSFCPQCGTNIKTYESANEVESKDSYENTNQVKSKLAADHLKSGYTIALDQPFVFIPSILSGIIGILISYGLRSINLDSSLSLILGLSSSLISFILSFASTDMSRDAYYRQTLDLGQSIEYVVGRFLEFLIAAVVGVLLSITIILIPVVVFMFVIMVIDETSFTDALSKAFNVIRADLADVIIIIIVSLVGSFIISYVPFFSTFLNSMLNVVIGIAFIDVYVTYQNR